MKHLINYNSQRDNISFAGKFPGFWQCFTTCSWMLMSYYCDKIKAGDDKGLSLYLDDVEAIVGKPGIGEKIKNKYINNVPKIVKESYPEIVIPELFMTCDSVRTITIILFSYKEKIREDRTFPFVLSSLFCHAYQKLIELIYSDESFMLILQSMHLIPLLPIPHEL